jgi:nudix-type nucleoside diphosphatase (YffH/AdpP family)
MAEPSDPGSGPFDTAQLGPGKKDGFEIIGAKRVYHTASPYPFEDAKPYFKVDAYRLKHRLHNGGTSNEIVREVFERGDAVGVLLFDRDERKVLVVKQFRLPTVIRHTGNGQIEETVAGEIGAGKTPKDTAIEITLRETGYRITDPEPIAEFFSSPGGTSERIHLFFAEVCKADRPSDSGKKQTDDIVVVEYSVKDFTDKLRRREFTDPKLVIAAYHLQARLGLRFDTDDAHDHGTDPATYEFIDRGGATVGLKTGDVLMVRGVDIWLNPENRYMMMSRMIDKGLSASIRWGGAEKHRNLQIASDTINNALRIAMAGRAEAHQNEIIETVPGALQKFGVKRLLHLPIAEAIGDHQALGGLMVDPQKIRPLVKEALRVADEGERGGRRFLALMRGRASRCTSVLIPMIGAGEGGITPYHCVPEILRGIDEFLFDHPTSSLKQFYLLGYWKREVLACQLQLKASPMLRSCS